MENFQTDRDKARFIMAEAQGITQGYTLDECREVIRSWYTSRRPLQGEIALLAFAVAKLCEDRVRNSNPLQLRSDVGRNHPGPVRVLCEAIETPLRNPILSTLHTLESETSCRQIDRTVSQGRGGFPRHMRGARR